MYRPIALHPNPVLYRRATEIDVVDDEIRRLLDDMTETMYAGHPGGPSGIGLAAPQVGVSLRAVVFDVVEPGTRRRRDDKPAAPKLVQVVNPVVEVTDTRLSLWEEGCLSLPGVGLEVERPSHVKLTGLDRNGEPLELVCSYIESTVIQHEIDHLDGVTLYSRMGRLKRQMLDREAGRRGWDGTARR